MVMKIQRISMVLICVILYVFLFSELVKAEIWENVSVVDNGHTQTISNLQNDGVYVRIDELFVKLGYSMKIYANGFEAKRDTHSFSLFDGRITHNNVVVNTEIYKGDRGGWFILREDVSKLGITLKKVDASAIISQTTYSLDKYVLNQKQSASYNSSVNPSVIMPVDTDSLSSLVVDKSAWKNQSFVSSPFEAVTPSENKNISNNGDKAYSNDVDYSKIKVSSLPCASVKASYIDYYEGIKNFNLEILARKDVNQEYKDVVFDTYMAAYNAQSRIQALDEGSMSGIVYKTPVYTKSNDGTSEHYARVMIENTSLAPMDKMQADARAVKLGKDAIIDRRTLADVPSFYALAKLLKSSGPLYAVYENSFDDTHVVETKMVVVRGAIKAEGFPELVIINDSDGFTAYQRYDEFMSGPIGIDMTFNMHLEGIYKPHIFRDW